MCSGFCHPERRPQPKRRISHSRRQRDASLPGTLWVQHDKPERICDSLHLVCGAGLFCPLLEGLIHLFQASSGVRITATRRERRE
jgi:hypothetical protein